MPFTPFHLGIAAIVKLFATGCFSFMIFGYSQVLIDVEPLVRLLRGEFAVHGLSHTYLGALAIGAVAAATGKYLFEGWFALWNAVFEHRAFRARTMIPWWVALLSSWVGTFSHVALDSVMHADMHPLFPFSNANSLLGLIPVGTLHVACVALAGIGGAGLLVRWLSAASRASSTRNP